MYQDHLARQVRKDIAMNITSEVEGVLANLACLSKLVPRNRGAFAARLFTIHSIAVKRGLKRSPIPRSMLTSEYEQLLAICLLEARANITAYPIPDEELQDEIQAQIVKLLNSQISEVEFAWNLWGAVSCGEFTNSEPQQLDFAMRIVNSAYQRSEDYAWTAYRWLMRPDFH